MPVALPIAMVGSSIIGGIASSNAASKAADAQTAAANQANATQLAMFNKTQENLAPFIHGGQNAQQYLAFLSGVPGTNSALPNGGMIPQGAFGSLTAPFAPTMDRLAQTPGYQFTLDQGLKAAQNGFAAQGLGSSGAAQKGAINYAEGLAGTTFQQQFQNYLAQNAQIYNMLYPQSIQGSNAAAQQGSISANVGAQVGQNTIGAGNASAAAAIAQGNAIGSIANSIPSAMMAYNNPYLNGSFATNTGSPAGFASGAAYLGTPGGYGTPWVNPDLMAGNAFYAAGGIT